MKNECCLDDDKVCIADGILSATSFQYSNCKDVGEFRKIAKKQYFTKEDVGKALKALKKDICHRSFKDNEGVHFCDNFGEQRKHLVSEGKCFYCKQIEEFFPFFRGENNG